MGEHVPGVRRRCAIARRVCCTRRPGARRCWPPRARAGPRERADLLAEGCRAGAGGDRRPTPTACCDALLTQKGEPRKFSEKLAGLDAGARRAGAARCSTAPRRAQHEAWLHQQRMARLARLLIRCFAEVKRAHGWVDMNDVEQAAHLLLGNADALGLGAGAARRARAASADRRVPGHQPAAVAGAARLARQLCGRRRPAARRVHRRRPQAEHLPLPPRRAAGVHRGQAVRPATGLDGDLLNCDHTHRNAPGRGRPGQRGRCSKRSRPASSAASATTRPNRARRGGVRQLPPIARDAVVAADAARGRRRAAALARQPDHAARAARGTAAAEGMRAGRALDRRAHRGRARAAAGSWCWRAAAAGSAALQDELRKLHIAVQQPEKNELHDAPEVQDMVALLDALVSPGPRPVAGAGAEVAAVRPRRRRAGADWRCAQRERRPPSWFELLQAARTWPGRCAGIGPRLRALAALAGRAAAARCAERDLPRRPTCSRASRAAAPAALRAGVLANLRGLLARVARTRRRALRHALRAWCARCVPAACARPPSPAADAVQLLTVHGAKGLEADLVLHARHRRRRPSARRPWACSSKWPGAGRGAGALRVRREREAPAGLQRSTTSREEQAARHREEINALYVATTRARSELVLSAVTAARPSAQQLVGAAGGALRADRPTCRGAVRR